jgi:hypothetical protein
MRLAILVGVGAALACAAVACGSSASPEKTATETFGCYVGSCVSPGVGDDDDDADAGTDAGNGDASR